MGIVSDFWRITPVCFVFVTCIIQVVHSGRQPYRKDNDDSIVYPGPTKGGTSNRYGEGPKSSIPDECKGQNFCTIKPRDYPEDKFNEYFKDLKPVVQPTLLLDTNELGNRQGDPNERDDCETTITYRPLYTVKTLSGDYRTVIQAPQKNYIQMIRLESCRNPTGNCFNVFPSVPGYETSCKQKYNVWELLVDGPNGPEKAQAELPVCCSCTYKSVPL